MLAPLFNLKDLIPACEQGQLIITANQRLCNKALQAWGYYQQQQGKDTWESPRIVSLDQWFQQCWQSLQQQSFAPSLKVIIDANEETLLWQKVIAQSHYPASNTLVNQAAKALSTLSLWRLPLACLDEYADSGLKSADGLSAAEHFQGWAKQFQSLLKQHQRITPEQSYQIIGEAFAQNRLNQEAIIHLVGFDTLPPLISEQIETAAHKVAMFTATADNSGALKRHSYSNTRAEIKAAASWAKTIVEQQPEARIGIILPNLARDRETIERILTETFEAHSLVSDEARYSLPFNISAGMPLSEAPLIHGTLNLLKLQASDWPLATICQIIHLPFWGQWSLQLAQRISLCQKLQSLGKLTISRSDLLHWSEKLAEPLFKYFYHFFQCQQQAFQRPSEWVNTFLLQLESLKWPGERQPDTIEYQQTDFWHQLLEKFSKLDHLSGTISAQTAISHLTSMAAQMPFQAKVTDSPIQVLGVLEGAGLHFSHCWVLGLDQQQWPPAPKPNPLLPLRLQRQQQMPHADHQRELQFAQSLTRQYRQAASVEVIMSSPEQNDKGDLSLSPSELIADIPLCAPFTISNAYEDYLHTLFNSRHQETVNCQQGPHYGSLACEPVDRLSGGANVLKAEASSPFDAFALYRLKAYNPLPAMTGFSFIEQGNILHNVMASLWETLKDQQTLCEQSSEALNSLVYSRAKDEVYKLRRQKPDHLGEKLCQLEIKRQSDMVMQWLAYEKKRPPFKVVAIEEAVTLSLLDTQIPLRIDRVDQLEDGSFLIIDYKSGNTTISAWKGERPRDPQLPLYFITQAESVSGIAFAQINIQACQLKGIHNGSMDVPGLQAIGDNRLDLPTHWQEAKLHWQRALENLLGEYLKGNCSIQHQAGEQPHPELESLSRFWEKDDLLDFMHHRKAK